MRYDLRRPVRARSGWTIHSGSHDVVLVYDGVRHNLYAYVDGVQTLQGPFDAARHFGSGAVDQLRMGFAAST